MFQPVRDAYLAWQKTQDQIPFDFDALDEAAVAEPTPPVEPSRLQMTAVSSNASSPQHRP
jgi:hypothetical protein